MSDQGDYDEDTSRRKYTGPYTSTHPIPTVQKYKERKEQRDRVGTPVEEEDRKEEESKTHKAFKAVEGIIKNEDGTAGSNEVYKAQNRNVTTGHQDTEREDGQEGDRDTSTGQKGPKPHRPSDETTDPRQKRKNMKHMKRDATGREVTDPVTHLPVIIHDSTGKDLKKVPENIPSAGSLPQTATGLSAASKSNAQLDCERKETQGGHEAMEKLFPPPEFDVAEEELVKMYRHAVNMALGSFVGFTSLLFFFIQLYNSRKTAKSRGDNSVINWWSCFVMPAIVMGLSVGVGSVLVWFTSGWLGRRVRSVWQDEVWDAARGEEQENLESSIPESTQWLNSLLSSVWPLINPDLFTSLADTLEDVMQASLPKLVRMISIEDLGQGSEAIRILGVKWLPTGAAARSVSVDGKLKSAKESHEKSDRKAPGEGSIEKNEKEDADGGNEKDHSKDETEEQDEENIAEGLEAEQGDFVNLELAFAYRARSSGKSLRAKAKNAHLYLAFYLPGGIKLPVWVELRGIIGTMRMRLQLTPDPPFFSLATITFLGQPKADLSCVPLTKHGLNIMDVPLISSFVQASIDTALAEYVAPKSLTLDLKDMLVGDDFKKDTNTRGIIVVKIRKAEGFKEGDGSLGPLRKGSSDPYVTVGWGKFRKPVSSTRVIEKEMHPFWNEIAWVLVGPAELNAEERLKVQLWDSDTSTADDDLGTVEVDLKQLMEDSRTKGKMCDRHDELRGTDGEEKVPGHLDWAVGYFPKSRITPDQLASQTEDPDIRSIDQLQQKVNKKAERKLREANLRDESDEIEQQKSQDYKEREDQLIISAPPPKDYRSGILSIQIHNIMGLEFEQINKNRTKSEQGDETNHGEDLPSSYCTIILNHQKIFKTRTKPKNAKPFFNAGTERFIRDWKTTDVMISCRDSRVHENDPLLGVVSLPLGRVFHSRSQLIDQFPLAGGIGYGRARISIVFRSIQLQSPPRLMGWDYGTLEFTSPFKTSTLDHSLRSLRIKIRTSVARAKVYPSDPKSEAHETTWTPKRDGETVCLAAVKRYSHCVVLEFRKSSLGPDKSPAFAILWLTSIPDEEEQHITLPVYPGSASLKRAETNCDITTSPADAKAQLHADKIGDIQFGVTFWRGLSAYHQKLARNDPNLKDVMDCLDVVHDRKDAGDGHLSSASDSSDEESGPHKPRKLHMMHGKHEHEHDDGAHDKGHEDGRRGPLAQIRDYKEHSGQLHRQHRGLMQWKAVRTVDWIKTKADHGKNNVLDTFRHNERDTGIETEV